MIALWFALAAQAQDDASPWGSLDAEASQPAQATRVTASLVVAVTKREEAADAIVAEAAALGGWFQSRTTSDVELRVPVEDVDAFLDAAAAQGKVLQRDLSRDDLGQQIAGIEGRLAAREDVLERYYEVLEQAGPKSIVAVEQQIVGAISTIESLKGQLRLLQDQASHGRINVSFQFRDRAAPARSGSSSFRWLNTLNLQDVLWGLREERASWRTRGAVVPVPPAGFSAWRRPSRYRAASPDDVLFRVRAERHKPKATLAFWQEAVRERMVAAGYSISTEAPIQASGTDGALLEFAAPMGTEDWTYLIAFFPKGRHLVVVEAVGEVSKLESRRDAIVEAIAHVIP